MSASTAPASSPAPAAPTGWTSREARFPAALFAAIGAALTAIGWATMVLLPLRAGEVRAPAFPGRPWLDIWVRWDSNWYWQIAEHGYWAAGGTGGKQHPTPFFPLYPVLMRGLTGVTGDVYLAGMIVTMVAGLCSALLLQRWSRAWMDERAARVVVITLLAYPFAWFLYGTVYSDALFLFLALSSFALLEQDDPLAAGLIGGLATATRPVAPAVTLGLVLRALERSGALTYDRGGGWPHRWVPRLHWHAVRPRDGAVLLSASGMAAYSAYLWALCGDPVAYLTAQKDWGMRPGPAVWFKVWVFQKLAEPHWDDLQLRILAHAVVIAAAFALVPRVFRRFGPAYGMYSLAVLLIAFVNNGNLIGGVGRYILAAFPCFAAGGDWIAERRWRLSILGVGALMLGVLFSAFARWYFVS